MHDRLGLRLVQRADGLVDVLGGLSNRRLGNDADPLAATRASQFFR